MPKAKTNKSLKRRVKVTGTGKFLYFRTGRRHLMTGKRASAVRPMRRPTALAPVNQRLVRRMLQAG